MSNSEKVAAVIVAAGESKRMEGVDKVFALLGGEPVLLRATRPFQQCPHVNQIVVVVSGDNKGRCQHLMGKGEWSKVTDVCLGGERRQDSVLAGIKQLKNYDWIIIHDGARPLVTVDLIEKGLEAAGKTGAAAAAVPVIDTIKVVGDDDIVKETTPRQNLRAVQTPQVFRFGIIKVVHQQDCGDVTDDASMAECLGHKVKLYMGSYKNIKVTTPDDLAFAHDA